MRAIRIIVIIIVLAGIAWAGLWYGASRFARSTLDQSAAAAAAGRPGADCTGRQITGFPLTLSIRCAETQVVVPVRGVEARLAGLVAEAPFYRPGFVTTALASPMTLNGPGEIRAEAMWRDANATATAGIFPMGVTQTSGTVEDLQLKLTGLPVDVVTVGHGAAGIGSSPVANSLRADVSFDALKMARAGGRDLPEATGEARLDLVDAGGTVTRDFDQQMRIWFASGGNVILDHATVQVGGVTFSATGKLSMSPAGVLSGDLNVSLTGVERVADLAETLHPGSREKADQVAGVLSALAQPVETDTGTTQRLSTRMAIRNGVVVLGFIPLFRLPSVFELAGAKAPHEG
jgi:hypothetical protein